LHELPNVSDQGSDVPVDPEMEQGDNVVAAVVIVVYTLAAGVALADPSLRDGIALIIAWLAGVFGATKDL
jgi:hypothetical protein